MYSVMYLFIRGIQGKIIAVQRFRLVRGRLVRRWWRGKRGLIDFTDTKKSNSELRISRNPLENGAEPTSQPVSLKIR